MQRLSTRTKNCLTDAKFRNVRDIIIKNKNPEKSLKTTVVFKT